MRAALIVAGLLSLSSGTIKQADQVFGGNSPTSSGQVACATAANAATWQAPTSCSLVTPTSNLWVVGTYLTPQNVSTPENVEIPATGSSTTTATILGFDMPSAGQAVKLQMGDNNVGLWNAFAKRMLMVSYHGIEIHGATGGAAQTFVAGGGTADPAVSIFSGGGGGALTLNATAGGNALTVSSGLASVQALTAAGNFTATAGANTYTGTVNSSALTLGASGAVIAGSYATTYTTAASPSTVAPSSCNTAYATVALTNSVTTATCEITERFNTGYNLIPRCRVSANGTVTVAFCNPSTANAAPPASSAYSVRVIQ